MRLLTTFSLAALFALTAACAVDPDSVETDDIEKDDDVTIDIDDIKEATPFPSRDFGRDVHEHLDTKLHLEYCEQNYDCESDRCDQTTNRCRDYPF